MSGKKGSTHHNTDVQGTADSWLARQLAELRQIQRRQDSQLDNFGESAARIRKDGSIKGEKKA